MDKIINRFASVKSVVTIILTFTFAYLSVIGRVGADSFITIFTVVIGFYYGTVVEKNKGAN